ncbi:hypothetical protein [Noviherbaspirillum cavernae]|nr:hypothetical protein [Noviherbaspirillum cavernae]
MAIAAITQAASGLPTAAASVNPVSHIATQIESLLSRAVSDYLPMAIDALDSSFNSGAKRGFPSAYCDGFRAGYDAWASSESRSVRPEVAGLLQGACLHTDDEPNQIMTAAFRLSLSDALDIIVRACRAANEAQQDAAEKMPSGFHSLHYNHIPGDHAFEKGRAYGAERGRQDGLADGIAAARAKQSMPTMLIYQAETIADELFK